MFFVLLFPIVKSFIMMYPLRGYLMCCFFTTGRDVNDLFINQQSEMGTNTKNKILIWENEFN